MKNDLTGKIYGRLTVLSLDRIYNKNSIWRCQCSCGNITLSYACSLKYGNKKSCGCLRGQIARDRLNYAQWKMKEYKSWSMMKNRCNNPNADQYKYYGAIGIKICKRWLNSFDNFLLDMGPAPSIKHSIERIDNEKGYLKSNCRWATMKEQCNNKRGLKLIEYNGKKQSLSLWCEELNLKYHKVWHRLYKHNWSVQDAFQ